MSSEYLISPAVVDMLSSKVGFVGSVVPTSTCKSISQGVQVLKPMSPLNPTFV
jgi:hypothetical protein